MKETVIRSMLAVSLAIAGDAALGEEPELKKVESVLDRLEKYLMDHQSEVLSFDEQQPHSPTDQKTEYKYKSQRITGELDEERQLRELAKAINELDSEVETFAAQVQKTKQEITRQSMTDNFVEIETTLTGTDAASIHSLVIKLDGFDVYQLQETSGIWMPNASLPIYAGPLSPGDHRLDLEVKLALSRQEGLPTSDNVYRFVNQSFDLKVPTGKLKKKWTIRITPPESIEGSPKLELTKI